MNARVVKSIVPLLVAGMLTGCASTQTAGMQPMSTPFEHGQAVVLRDHLYRFSRASNDTLIFTPVLVPDPGGIGRRVPLRVSGQAAGQDLSGAITLSLIPDAPSCAPGDTQRILRMDIVGMRSNNANSGFIVAGVVLGLVFVLARAHAWQPHEKRSASKSNNGPAWWYPFPD